VQKAHKPVWRSFEFPTTLECAEATQTSLWRSFEFPTTLVCAEATQTSLTVFWISHHSRVCRSHTNQSDDLLNFPHKSVNPSVALTSLTIRPLLDNTGCIWTNFFDANKRLCVTTLSLQFPLLNVCLDYLTTTQTDRYCYLAICCNWGLPQEVLTLVDRWVGPRKEIIREEDVLCTVVRSSNLVYLRSGSVRLWPGPEEESITSYSCFSLGRGLLLILA
jgi:hypothetical protein